MNETSTRWGRVKTQIFNKVRAAGRITSYVLYACLIAVTYGYVTYPTMYALFEEGYVLEAYVYNLLTIVFWLLLEKLTRRMMALRKRLSKTLFTKIVPISLTRSKPDWTNWRRPSRNFGDSAKQVRSRRFII